MLFRIDFKKFQRLALREVRQHPVTRLDLFFLVFISRRLFLIFHVHFHEPMKLDDGAVGPEHQIAALDIKLRRVQNRRHHLAGHRASPDQIVKPVQVFFDFRLERLGFDIDVGGTDGLMRFLRRLLTFINVGLGREVILAEFLFNISPQVSHGFFGQAGRVGSHISDQADIALPFQRHPFVQALRQHHGLFGRETEFPRSFLLQRAGDERRNGVALPLLLDDVLKFEGLAFRLGDQLLGLFLIGNFRFLIADLLQFRREGGFLAAFEFGGDAPVFFLLEAFDFLFPFADHAERDRLHPSRAEPAVHLLPQQGADLVTDEPVENAPRLLRVDLVSIEFRRVLQRFLHALLGDLIEQHAVNLAFDQRRHLVADVMRDRFSLAIRVRSQVDIVHLLRRRLQSAQDLALAANGDVLRAEVIFNIHPQFLFGQVLDVPHGRLDDEILAHNLLERVHLGGRLDYQ